jgi:hypothetical protein
MPERILRYDWVVIFSGLGVLLSWGFTWWAAYRLLCCVGQLIQYVPGYCHDYTSSLFRRSKARTGLRQQSTRESVLFAGTSTSHEQS